MEQKRTRRTFEPEFKIQAAKRVVEGKEKAAAVATDLGINLVSLYNWVKDYEKHKKANAPSASAPAPAEAPSQKVEQEPAPQPAAAAPASEPPKRPKLQLKKPRIQATRPEDPAYSEEALSPAAPSEATLPLEVPAPAITPEVPTFELEAPSSDFSKERAPREFNNGKGQGQRRFNPYQRSPRPYQRKEQRDAQQTKAAPAPSFDTYDEMASLEPQEPAAPEAPAWPTPSAAQGRSWKVMHALDQRPNYREESAQFGYVDEFALPAETLPEVWAILEVMQKKADKRAFAEMVHQKEINVPPEVLADPRTMTVQGPNIPNKPWLRKPRLNPIADGFFQTTPDYTKSVYETYGGITLRLEKNSTGSPILLVVPSPEGGKDITIDFSKFDRFVDDFYGDFVRNCKTVMMKQNPKEYPSLNAFIRIPDEPIWNPKLWAGVRTFNWRDGESLSEAWIRYAQNQRRNSRNQRNYYRNDLSE